MPSLKTDHVSKPTSTSSSQQSISRLEDGLPLVRRRRQGSPLVLPCLTIGIGVCVILLTGAVVYLVVSSYHVQKQLGAVQLELEKANERMDSLEKEHSELHSHDIQKKSLKGTEISKLQSNFSADATHNSSTEQNPKEKLHKLRKREVPIPHKKHPHPKKKSDRNFEEKKPGDIFEELKTLKRDLKNLGHPSAHMVLPATGDGDHNTSIGHSPSTAGNRVVTWTAKHNALFDTNDSAHFVVRTPGSYFIYLQITYNGQDRRVYPTCSHLVKSVNSESNRTRLLLYGSATQYNLGGMIRIRADGEVLTPIDTVHVSGIFHLMPGDRIHVEPDPFSRECVVSGFTDKSFFGAFRLQSFFHNPDPHDQP